MGYPIDNYSALASLASINIDDNGQFENSWPYAETVLHFKNSISNFNLFGFIIHDPKEHSDFDKYLNSIFKVLDHSTGECFLFFALVSPSKEWIIKHSSSEYLNYISNLEKELKPIFDQFIKTNNPSEAAYVLAHSLKIPLNDLPVIVVTNDLFEKNYRWYKTGPNHIANQLNFLGFLATDNPNIKGSWENTEKVLIDNHDDLDPFKTSDSGTLIEGLVNALSDILSLILVSNQDVNNWEEYPAIIEQAKEQASSSIVKLLETIKGLRVKDVGEDIIDEELFDHLNLKLVEFLSLLNQKSQNSIKKHLNISEKFLEKDSSYMQLTANKVLNLLKREDKYLQSLSIKEDGFDYSSIGICLTKLFEKEIRLSVVQWIRQTLGVKLPEYFDKFQKGVPATYKPQDLQFTVDFNKENKNSWQPPTLGQSQPCFKSMRSKEDFYQEFKYIDESKIDLFLDYWKELSLLRNTCAHSEIVPAEKLERIMTLLTEINKMGIFKNIYQMKQKLRHGVLPAN